MILQFGKHKDKDICDVDIGYLTWLEEQDWIKDDLRSELVTEIQRRVSEVTSKGKVLGWKKFIIHIKDENKTIEITLTLPVAITELPKLNFKGSGCGMWQLVKIDKS